MTEDEVFECLDLEIPVQHAPSPYPPNKVGTVAAFYVEPNLSGPGISEGHHLFRFVQTYWYRDGVALQIWELAGQYFCSRIGTQESLVYFGDDLSQPLHHTQIFKPQTAEQHFADMVERRVDRDLFTDELQWRSYCATRADNIVKSRERNGGLS